jgi:hypothetical protein
LLQARMDPALWQGNTLQCMLRQLEKNHRPALARLFGARSRSV